MIRRSILTLAAAVPLLATGGCLVISGHSTYESGVRVSRPTLSQIKIGTTTDAWVLATLGEPTRRSPVPGHDNQEILVYRHVVEESSEGTVLFLFAGDSDHTQRSVVYFEITDGVVTRYWTEE